MKSVFIWGHRGSPEKVVENTIQSFLAALEDGADGLELDVQLSADNQVVVFHDYDLKRLAGVEERIDELTLTELQELDLRTDSIPSGKIPTLEMVFEAIPYTVPVNVELKAGNNLEDGLESAVARVITQFSAVDRVVVSSFNPIRLRNMRRIEPRIRTAFIHSKSIREFPERTIARLAGPVNGLHPHHTLIDEEYISMARAKGRFINAWPIDNQEDLEKVLALRIDAVTTNRSDAVRKWLG